MADFSVQDTIGALLNAYTTREQAKIDARLTRSREQREAYDEAAKSQAIVDREKASAAAGKAWVLPVLVLVGGALLWKVLKK